MKSAVLPEKLGSAFTMSNKYDTENNGFPKLAWQSLPSDLYECASLDGANGFQKFRKLTIPLLANTTFFITITSIISSFQVFGYINVMTGGGPKDSTYVLVYYIYKLAFDYHKTGYGSAVAVVLFLILLIITIIQYVHNNKQD